MMDRALRATLRGILLGIFETARAGLVLLDGSENGDDAALQRIKDAARDGSGLGTFGEDHEDGDDA